MTTAESQKILDTALDAALQLLPESTEYKLFFVVPERRFNSFKKQQVTSTRGTKPQESQGRVPYVKKYVLRLEMV